MKISMMTYTMACGPWGKEHDIRSLCEFTRELRIDGIDWVTTYGEDPAEIRRITVDMGLANICYTFFAELQYPGRERRSKALDQVREGLQTARVLGADKVMIVLPGVEGVDREVTRKYALEGLAGAVELGRDAGLTVTIEHFPGASSPFVTSADMNQAVLDVPGLKITYDNGNVATGGQDPAEGFWNSREHVVHAHFKDWVLAEDGTPGLDGRRYKPALVGEGIVDPRPCLEAMAEAGYQGYINFEYQGSDYDPADAMTRGVRFVREAIREVTGRPVKSLPAGDRPCRAF